MELTKTAVRRIQVEERKLARVRQSDSLFLRRTCSIWNAQKKRAAKGKGKAKGKVRYSLDELRQHVSIGEGCGYCQKKLTPKTFTLDHAEPVSRGGKWTLCNLIVACKPCNFAKGSLTDGEFKKLLIVLGEFPPEAALDVRRRLTTGGKFLNR